MVLVDELEFIEIFRQEGKKEVFSFIDDAVHFFMPALYRRDIVIIRMQKNRPLA